MSKKVYKNKLVREMEERKEERRKKMNPEKEKTKKTDRMEDMYKKLSSMTEDEIKKRIEEIDKRYSDLEKEAYGRTENGKEITEEVYNRIVREVTNLEKEKNRLENFSKVKTQIERIRSLRDKTVTRKKKSYLKAKQELKEIKDKLKEIEDRTKKIDELTKKVEKYQTNFTKNIEITDEDREGYFDTLKKLESMQKEDNGNKSITELKTKLKVSEDKVKLYESGKSKEDAVINKCNVAWKMLLAGKTWDEISLAAIEEVKDKNKQRKQTEIRQNTMPDAKQIPEGQEKVRTNPETNNNQEKENESTTKQKETIWSKIKAGVKSIVTKKESNNQALEKKEKSTIWTKIKSGFKKFVDTVKPLPLPEENKNSNENVEKESNIQRDAFMQELRAYANREDGDRKHFGGLEVEKQAYSRIANSEIDQNEEKLVESLRNLQNENSKEEQEETR